MRAEVRDCPEGFVVVVYPTWEEQIDLGVDLRLIGGCAKCACFGWWRSAAMEFCQYLNRLGPPDRRNLKLRGWIGSYDPEVKYQYPEFNAKGELMRMPKQQPKE